MANIKLTNDNWETSGIYDITQGKTQRQINSDLNGAISELWDTPQKHGALADGSTDDTTAIQAALYSDSAVVFFPEGTYLISEAISIPSNKTILGSGENSIIKAKTGFDNGISLYCMVTTQNRSLTNNSDSNIIIRNICFDNNGISNAGNQGIISFWGVANSRIENCLIKVSGSNCWGIDLFGSNDNITIVGCKVINSATDNNLGGCIWCRNGLDLRSSTNILIDNCYLSSTAKDELLCISSTYKNSLNEVTVRNTKIEEKAVTTHPGFAVCVYTETETNASVKAILDGLLISGNVTNYAIYTYNSTGTTKPIISNCEIEMTAGGGISGSTIAEVYNCRITCATNYSIQNATAYNCKLYTRGVYNTNIYNSQIYATNSSGVENSEIVKNCLIDTAYHGIIIGANASRNVSFENNIIKASLNGITMNASVSSISGIISGNDIKRNVNTINTGTYGIYVPKLTATLIVSNNRVDSNNAEETNYTFRYGVIVEDKANRVQNFITTDFRPWHGAISSGTAGTKTVGHAKNSLHLIVAQQNDSSNMLAALVWNSAIMPLNSNEYFTIAANSDTEIAITSTQTTRFSSFLLVEFGKLA